MSKRRRIQAGAPGAHMQRTLQTAALAPLEQLVVALPQDVLEAVASELPQVLEQQQRLSGMAETDAHEDSRTPTSSGEVVCGLARALQSAVMPALSQGFCISLEHDGAALAARLVANASSVEELTLRQCPGPWPDSVSPDDRDAVMLQLRQRAAAVGAALSASSALSDLTLHLHAPCAADLLLHHAARRQLTKLSVYRVPGYTSDAELARLSKAIAACTQLQSLRLQVELTSKQGAADFMCALARALPRLRAITLLSLDAMDDSDGVSLVIRGRAHTMCAKVVENVSALSALQSLSFVHGIMRSVEAQRAFARVLGGCAGLQELTLRKCQDDDDSKVAVQLPELMPHLRRLAGLTALVISESCVAYNEAAGPLPPQLRRLEISDCSFESKAAAVAIVTQLPTLAALEELDMFSAVIAMSHSGVQAAMALSSLVSLTSLDLSYMLDYAHEIATQEEYEQAVEWFCACISCLPSLQDLCLTGFPATYSGCQQFASALDAATSLTRLDVQYWLKLEEIVALRPHLEALPNLQCLVVDLTAEIKQNVLDEVYQGHVSQLEWPQVLYAHETFVSDDDKLAHKVYARLCEHNAAWGPKLSELAGIRDEVHKVWEAGAGRRRKARVQKQLECTMYNRNSSDGSDALDNE